VVSFVILLARFLGAFLVDHGVQGDQRRSGIEDARSTAGHRTVGERLRRLRSVDASEADFGLGAIGGSLGSAPSYLASYRADGSIRFASIPSSGGVAQEPQSLAIGPDGQLALADYFNGTTAFGAVSLTSHSCAYIGCDAFVQVFSP